VNPPNHTLPVSAFAAQAPSLLWPALTGPDDLAAVEAVELSARRLPVSTYAALERAAHLWPDRSAVTLLPSAERYRDGRTRGYAPLLADVRRAANALTAAGVTRRTAVGLLSPNNAELLTALLAAQAAGIAAPANPGLASEHLTGIFERAAVRVLVAAGPEVDPGLWSTARQVAHRLRATTLLALRPTDAAGTPPPLEPLDGTDVAYLTGRAQSQPGDRLLAAAPASTDLASFFHTGGTTGTPKLAAHTHANEVSDAWMIAAGSAVPEDAVVFAALPLFHVNALVVTVLAPLLRGRHVVWAGPLGFREPGLYRTFWRIVEHHKVATLSAVPTVYAALTKVPVDADISSLRFAAVGASPLPATVQQAFELGTGVALAEGYGLTEATCASARQFPGQPRRGSVGQRLPYQRVKAVRRPGAAGARVDLDPGEPGALLVQGPNVFPGYVVGHDADGPVLDHSARSRTAGWTPETSPGSTTTATST